MSSPHWLTAAAGAGVLPTASRHMLHVFPSFGIGGVPLRMVRIINHLGKRFRHTIIALDSNFEAAADIAEHLDVRLLPGPYSRRGLVRAVAGNAQALHRMRPDLLLTYNWGAIEWAMAGRMMQGSRHVHLEAGFGRAEADAQLARRVLFRRWALGGCALIVVPSRQLESLARHVWRLPAERIAYVPNGVDTARFAAPARDTLPQFARRRDELVIGTVAPLRPEKNVGRLLKVFAALPDAISLRLVIAGEGTERPALERAAAELGIAERVIFAGRVAPESVLGTFDIFALSSDTEQMPNALLEAMAASRAVAAVDVGDVKNIVSEGNREFIVPRDDAPAFVRVISRLLGDPALRAELGRKNWDRVVTEFSQERMFAAYSAIFGSACPNGAA